MNRKARFTQADVSKAVKGAKRAGLDVTRMEIDPTGRIVLFAGERPSSPTTTAEAALLAWQAKNTG